MENTMKLIEESRRKVMENANSQLKILDEMEHKVKLLVGFGDVCPKKESNMYKDFDMNAYIKSYSNKKYSKEINQIHNLLLQKYNINIAKYNIK